MRNLHNANAPIMGKSQHQCTKRFRGSVVKLRGGFIENKVCRIHSKYAREREALLFPTRKLRRISMSIRFKTDKGQSLRNTALNLIFVQT